MDYLRKSTLNFQIRPKWHNFPLFFGHRHAAQPMESEEYKFELKSLSSNTTWQIILLCIQNLFSEVMWNQSRKRTWLNLHICLRSTKPKPNNKLQCHASLKKNLHVKRANLKLQPFTVWCRGVTHKSVTMLINSHTLVHNSQSKSENSSKKTNSKRQKGRINLCLRSVFFLFLVFSSHRWPCIFLLIKLAFSKFIT